MAASRAAVPGVVRWPVPGSGCGPAGSGQAATSACSSGVRIPASVTPTRSASTTGIRARTAAGSFVVRHGDLADQRGDGRRSAFR